MMDANPVERALRAGLYAQAWGLFVDEKTIFCR